MSVAATTVGTVLRMIEPPPEPSSTTGDPKMLLDGFLDFHRNAVLRKLEGLTDEQLRASAVPTGWTPLGLLKHLAFVELRWMRWGFAAEPIADPWADSAPDGGWHVEPDETPEQLTAFFRHQCSISRKIATHANLHDHAAVGGRFPFGEQPPTLAWIQFHLLQEYARHAGHLDIVRELGDGTVGE